MEIAEALKQIRKSLALTQEELASKLKVSFTTINRWETGKSLPRGNKLSNIITLHEGITGKKAALKKNKGVKNYTSYALFAGAGGFHIGIEKAGFKVEVASDIEPTAELTHKKNWPQLPFKLEDIRKVSGSELLRMAKGKRPDLIIGGPPCQGFSTLGSKQSSDPRNILFDHYARIVEELNPKCFLFENVKSFVTMYEGQYRDYVIKRFSDIGYTIYETILNAADYGVPQMRNRVFFFGTKLNSPFRFPAPTHGMNLAPYKTVGDAIMDLHKLKNEQVPNHLILDHSEIVIQRYKLIPEGGKLPSPEKLPVEIRRLNFGNTYKRLHRKKPALTMVPGNNAFPIHPTLDRSLTPREAARIQTFPDEHIFVGDRRKQCILVGNAVPPKLAEAIGKEILNHLEGKTPKEDADKPVTVISSTKSENTKLEKILPLKHIEKLDEEQGFVDLFCGAGGFTIGFARAGWKPLLGVDIDKAVAKTHKYNFPSFPFLNASLAEDKVREVIYDRFEGKKIGVVVGGPPCQGFSMFGKRRFINTQGYNPHVDPRNKLVYAYIDIVKNLSPRWFIMENVPGLANLDGGLFLKEIIHQFKELGYNNTEYKILNAADYGVPQLRKRLIIIGNKTGHIIPWPKKKYFDIPKDWQKPYRTVGEVISDLATEKSLERYTCHVPMNHKPLLVERYKYIEEGEKLNVDKLPQELKKGYRTEEVKNYSHVFKRLHRERPSTTMVPGHNAFPIHPWLHRALTVREAARIQTFPDQIDFQGNRQEQCIQVGNAFPVMLAEILANSIHKAEENNWRPGNVPQSAWNSLLEKNDDILTA